MTPINSQYGAPLQGLDAELAALNRAPAPDGGVGQNPGLHAGPPDDTEGEQPSQFQGLGPFLEDEDPVVFKEIHNLVLRQEPLAKNRKALDDYYTACKNGHSLWFNLTKIQDQDIYKCELMPGANAIVKTAVPNKLADLCCKIVETLMVDPPQPSPQAENDSEEAERAVEMAEEFLTQDGGDSGTRDARLIWQLLDSATSKSAQFSHYWVDQTGNGSVPLQIKAHPQAQDPNAPSMAMDAMGQPAPTTDFVLRYVSGEVVSDEAGKIQFAPGVQFTEDPSQAATSWQPKIRIDKYGREHVRCYPETADISDAEMVIVLGFATLDEAKRRWPDTVGQMEDSELSALCDWTPPRYMHLLPPALRARWKLQDSSAAKDQKGTSNDQRVMFFYLCYRRCTPTYKKGCAVAISGANTGTCLGKDTLTASVPMPKGGTDVRNLDIPLAQWDLVLDADDQDPMCKPLAERISGANEASSRLAQSFLDAIDIILHPAYYATVTSPVTGDDVLNSRATGNHIPVLSKDDYPQAEAPRALPDNFFNGLSWQYDAMESAFGVSKASLGADKQQEVSGVARSIAVQQANVALSRMQQGLVSSYERHCRIKLQQAVKHFSAPQMIRYVGEDGAYKQEWFSGVDFALVTDVKVQAGTATMMPPQQKLQYIQAMQAAGYVGPEDAADAARPTFAGTLGLPEDPVTQHIESQVSGFLKGPPFEGWIQQAQTFNQAKAVADQQNAVAQQQYQQHEQQKLAVHASQPKPSEGQPGAIQPPQDPPPQPIQPMDQNGQPLPPPWTPFQPLPCDDEPLIASQRQRRLVRLMLSARFKAQPPEWQQTVITEYVRMRTAVAASQAPPALPHGVSIGVKAGPGDVAQAEQAATHPNAQKAA